MSGGSHNYVCYTIESELCGQMADDELNEMIQDIADLAHELEWWCSGDTSENKYRNAVAKFKKKWFGSNREARLKGYIDKKTERLKEELYALVGVKQ